MADATQGSGGTLDGIRVIELAQLIAGPSAGMMLREMGAEIIKVELPGQGDRSRALSRTGIFESYNRGKKSVALDLKSAEGKAQFRQLAATADVVIDGSIPGAMQRLGLCADALTKGNPRLIHLAIAAFNPEGPDATRAGLDAVIQAESGLMSITGPDGGEPVKVGCQVVDAATGLAAAQAILAALLRRARTGRGQQITTSLFDVAVYLQSGAIRDYLVSGQEQGRIGNCTGFGYPTDLFECTDGFLQIAAYFPDKWASLCDVLGQPQLASHPDYHSNSLRIENRASLRQRLSDLFRRRPRADWIALLAARGIACGEVRSHRDVIERLAATTAMPFGPIEGAAPARSGENWVVRSPLRGAELGVTHIAAAPPQLGQHTSEVLAALRPDLAEF